MRTKKIVLIGGPGSGKTSLISAFEKSGKKVMPEISRAIILEAQRDGIAQLFLESPVLFSQKLLEGRLAQFYEAEKSKENLIFFDRGMPDVTCYMDFLGTPYPNHFSEICLQNRYDAIFLLPPWEEIYQQDNERYETFEQANILYTYLKNGYEKYGYILNEVPLESVENRIKYIEEKLKSLF